MSVAKLWCLCLAPLSICIAVRALCPGVLQQWPTGAGGAGAERGVAGGEADLEPVLLLWAGAGWGGGGSLIK